MVGNGDAKETTVSCRVSRVGLGLRGLRLTVQGLRSL